MKVCDKCFNDIELHSHVYSLSKEEGKCKYCQSTSALIDIEELLDFFIELFDTFRTDDNGIPLIDIIQKDWNLFSSNHVASQIIQDILHHVKHTFDNPSVKVVHIDEIGDNISYWNTLKEDLKWERRYFVKIENIKDLGWDSYFNRQTTIGVGEFLYRARIHQVGDQNCYPVKEMGCPNKEIVSGGRANPNGIPYLYLCKSIETSLYETRVLFHDEVSIGKFEVINRTDLKLVDFTEQPSAYIGMGELKNYTKEILLKKLISSDLSKPIRRYDSEIEYIPTQFICEFVRYFIGADGILFNSSLHKGGKNIVLFDEGKVKCISVSKYSITGVNISYSQIIDE